MPQGGHVAFGSSVVKDDLAPQFRALGILRAQRVYSAFVLGPVRFNSQLSHAIHGLILVRPKVLEQARKSSARHFVIGRWYYVRRHRRLI